MMVRGDPRSSPKAPYVVGVCSAEGGSESVGEVSESVGSWGEVITLRSYSSSASESAWYAVGNAMLVMIITVYLRADVVKPGAQKCWIFQRS